jgi:hypothetical protein
MFYSPQVRPRTAVDLFSQDLIPALPCFLSQKVGAKQENLVCDWHNRFLGFFMGLLGCLDQFGLDRVFLDFDS